MSSNCFNFRPCKLAEMATLLLSARCTVQISVMLLAILTEVFHGVPQSLQTNAEEVAKNMTASVHILPYLLYTNHEII
jgi:hypothetical protein